MIALCASEVANVAVNLLLSTLLLLKRGKTASSWNSNAYVPADFFLGACNNEKRKKKRIIVKLKEEKKSMIFPLFLLLFVRREKFPRALSIYIFFLTSLVGFAFGKFISQNALHRLLFSYPKKAK